MNKIVSNILIVSTQLVVGGLFLFMLFSDSNTDSRVVVVENNNLDKMADAVSELFEVDHVVAESSANDNDQTVEVIFSAEEQKRLEEEKEKALEEAKVLAEENRKKALEEAEQKRIEEEQKKALEEEEKKKIEEAERKALEEANNLVEIDPSGYTSKPALGFNVTTNNKIYTLSDTDFAILATVVNCEAKRSSKDDILAVVSVILNRADSSRYPNDPVSVVAAPYQFSCFKGHDNVVNVSDEVANVIKDALNGIRNNNYHSFRSWGTSTYSDKYIVEGGNRYS